MNVKEHVEGFRQVREMRRELNDYVELFRLIIGGEARRGGYGGAARRLNRLWPKCLSAASLGLVK